MEHQPILKSKPSVELNTTFNHTIEEYNFDNLSLEQTKTIYMDGRVFSHFIEHWIAKNYSLTHVPGCKDHDFKDKIHSEIIYDQKTFTERGCSFCPSNMLVQGRKFEPSRFEEHCKKLIFCIVSNIHFPNIKIRFVKGTELFVKYPKGKIPLKDHIEFFN